MPYWVGRAVGDDDVSGYAVNTEIDDVEWVAYDEALDRLTYPHDRETLREAGKVRRRTHPLVMLRHSQARSRKAWRRNDRRRPLLRAGQRAGPATGPGPGGVRRHAGRHLQQHPLRGDRRAVRRGDRADSSSSRTA